MGMSSKDMVKAAKAAVHQPSREPTRRLAVVTCMDARVDPWRILRAGPGEIHVLRNAGGIVTEDVIRSLVVSQTQLGTNQVMVIMHTDCGLEGTDEAAVAAAVREATGAELTMLLGSFESVRDELERGVRALRDSPLIQGTVSGAVYDVRTEALRAIDA